MSKYAYATRSKEDAKALLSDDALFHDMVKNAKHVVTHYFAFKQEAWMREVISPIYDIDHCIESKEFAKGRGAIHSHGNAYGNGPTYTRLDRQLGTLGIDVYNTFMAEQDKISAQEKPLLERNMHELIIKNTSTFLAEQLKRASASISSILRTKYGFTASHVGTYPLEWPSPGGSVDVGHRGTHPSMLSKRDILQKRVLQQFKFQHEKCLYCRRVNMTNHCWDHKCSNYCWNTRTMDVIYCEEKHGPREGNPDVKET